MPIAIQNGETNAVQYAHLNSIGFIEDASQTRVSNINNGIVVPSDSTLIVNSSGLNNTTFYFTTSDNSSTVLISSTSNTSTRTIQTNGTNIYYHGNGLIATSNATSIYTGNIWSYGINVDYTLLNKKSPYELRRKRKSIRNSLKRAINLIANFGMEEDLKIFLGGDSIEVSHPESDYKFIISPYVGNLFNKTENPSFSTPFKLEMYTKTNIHLTNLCVYMRDTPILDQFLGLAMFIKNGYEEDVVKAANFYSITDDRELKEEIFDTDPLLGKKLLRLR